MGTVIHVRLRLFMVADNTSTTCNVFVMLECVGASKRSDWYQLTGYYFVHFSIILELFSLGACRFVSCTFGDIVWFLGDNDK